MHVNTIHTVSQYKGDKRFKKNKFNFRWEEREVDQCGRKIGER